MSKRSQTQRTQRNVVGIEESDDSADDVPSNKSLPRQSQDGQDASVRPPKRSRLSSHDGAGTAEAVQQGAPGGADAPTQNAPAADDMDVDPSLQQQEYLQQNADAAETAAAESPQGAREQQGPNASNGMGTPSAKASGCLVNIFPAGSGGPFDSVAVPAGSSGAAEAAGNLRPRHSVRQGKPSERLDLDHMGSKAPSRQLPMLKKNANKRERRNYIKSLWQGADKDWGQGAETLPKDAKNPVKPPSRESAYGWEIWAFYEDVKKWYRGLVLHYDSKKEVYQLIMEDGELAENQEVQRIADDVQKNEFVFCRPPSWQLSKQSSDAAAAVGVPYQDEQAQQEKPEALAEKPPATASAQRKPKPLQLLQERQQQQQQQLATRQEERNPADVSALATAAAPAVEADAVVNAGLASAEAAVKPHLAAEGMSHRQKHQAAEPQASQEANTQRHKQAAAAAEPPLKADAQQQAAAELPKKAPQQLQQGSKQQRMQLKKAGAAAAAKPGGKRPAAAGAEAAGVAARGAMQRPQSASRVQLQQQQQQPDFAGLSKQAQQLGACMWKLSQGARQIQQALLKQLKVIEEFKAHADKELYQGLKEAAQEVKSHLDAQPNSKNQGTTLFNMVQRVAHAAPYKNAQLQKEAGELWEAISGMPVSGTGTQGGAAPAVGAAGQQQQRRPESADAEGKQQQQRRQQQPHHTPTKQQQQRRPPDTPGKQPSGLLRQEPDKAAASLVDVTPSLHDAEAAAVRGTAGVHKRSRDGSVKPDVLATGLQAEPEQQLEDAAAVLLAPDQKLVQRFLNLVPLQPLDDPLREKAVELLSAVLQPPMAVSPYAVAHEVEERLHTQHGIIGPGKGMYLRHLYLIWCALGGKELMAAAEAAAQAEAAVAAAGITVKSEGDGETMHAEEAAAAAGQATKAAAAAADAARSVLEGAPGAADAAAVRTALLNGTATVDELVSMTCKQLGFDHQRDK